MVVDDVSIEKFEKFYVLLQKIALDPKYLYYSDKKDYRSLRKEILANSELRSKVPEFVIACPELENFRNDIMAKAGSNEARRTFVADKFEPAFSVIYGTPTGGAISPEKSGGEIPSERLPEHMEKSILKKENAPQIFIIHGHDPTSLTYLKNILYKIGANPLIFDDIPKHGSPTIIEILEDCIPKCDAVIALLTPDDEGRKRGDKACELRARQNVLIEAGYGLISRREKSLIIALGDVSTPSDFEGLHMIRATTWSNETGMKAAKRLKDMGIKVDPSKAI